MAIPPIPGRWWTPAVSEALEHCERRAFYRVYGSWGGWNPGTPDRRARDLYLARARVPLLVLAQDLLSDVVPARVMAQLGMSTVSHGWGTDAPAVLWEAVRAGRHEDWPPGVPRALVTDDAGAPVDDTDVDRVARALGHAQVVLAQAAKDQCRVSSTIRVERGVSYPALRGVQVNGPPLLLGRTPGSPGTWTAIVPRLVQGPRPVLPPGEALSLAALASLVLLENQAMDTSDPLHLLVLGDDPGAPRPVTQDMLFDADDLREGRARIDGGVDWLSATRVPGTAGTSIHFARTANRDTCFSCPYLSTCTSEP